MGRAAILNYSTVCVKIHLGICYVLSVKGRQDGAWISLLDVYTDTKGVGKSRHDGEMLHAPDVFLSQREISNHFVIFSACLPIPKDGIFPPCRNFFPIPILYAGKIPSLTEGIPAYFMQNKSAVGGSKNIPLTVEGIIRRT